MTTHNGFNCKSLDRALQQNHLVVKDFAYVPIPNSLAQQKQIASHTPSMFTSYDSARQLGMFNTVIGLQPSPYFDAAMDISYQSDETGLPVTD